MWCRTILTAVAISYVICMLLWSGLKKEDLGANTLEKLARYNVNIEDMNNEQRRQECLLDPATTEIQREALGTSASSDRIENYVTVGIYPETVVILATSFGNKTVVQNDKTKSYFDPLPVVAQKNPDLGNVTKFEGNKGIIKIEYNIQNQPDVESVMNFWTKLTSYTKTVETAVPTIPAPVTTTVQVETHKAKKVSETHNNGYVHSREMEYISRILAEYLANTTIPNTSERVSTRKVFPKYVPIKYWEVSTKAPIEEGSNLQNEQRNYINKKTYVTKDHLHSDKVIYTSMSDENKSKPFKVTHDGTQILKRIQETPYSQTLITEPKIRESKTVKKKNPIGILYRLLQMKSDLFNNGVLIPETESTTKTIELFTNKSNEQRENSKSFNLFNIFQNINDVNKSNSENYMIINDQSTSAPITAETWEPVPLSHEKMNKELNEKGDELMPNFDTNNNQIQVKPPDIKIVHQNSYMKPNGSRFQAMLPSIKYSKQNKNVETPNNQVIEMPSEFHKLEQNENFKLSSSKKAVVSRQPAAIEKFVRNQLFKMKNDTFNADSGIIIYIKQNSKELDGKQFKKAPVFHNWEPTSDSKNIKAVPEIINNYDRDKEQVIPVNVKGLKPIQHFDSMNMSNLQAIPASIIKEIAEKVKRMVLKDIEKDVTTTVPPASSTTSTTAAPITISSTFMTTAITTSEIPYTSHQKEFTQTNHVMLKLMEIFKELKAMKDTAKPSNQVAQNATTVSNGTTNLPQLPIQTYPEAVASFNPYLMQNPPIFKAMQARSASRIVQVPISTGPITRNKAPKYMSPLNAQPTKDYRIGAITFQTNADEIAPLAIQVSKPLKLMNQHIVVTTKRAVDKLKEERERDSMKHIEENFRIPTKDRNHHVRFAEKHEFKDQYSYRGKYMDKEKSWYNHENHEKVHNMGNTHTVPSRFPELRYPGRLTHLEHLGQPRYLGTSEDFNYPRGYNRPDFNAPGSHHSGIRHHPGSYGHSDYDRQPRYEAKFHEKLERIENWPRSTWKDFHSPSESSNDEISARQQVPLVKVKQRTRYDDSHFTKFLKSQQKVTDMLEKILANNVKNSGPHSVETP